MSTLLISFGIIITIVFLIGVFYTIKEFHEMSDHPEDYRRPEAPEEEKNIDRAS